MFIKFLKTVTVILLTAGDLVCFLTGVFCLYGGACGEAFCANALIGATIGIGASVIMAAAVLAVCHFKKRLLLTSLILHETVLFLFFVLMVVATIFSKAMTQIMVHPIVLLALLGVGVGIFKTINAIKDKR